MGRRRGLDVQKYPHLSLISIAHVHQDTLIMWNVLSDVW